MIDDPKLSSRCEGSLVFYNSDGERTIFDDKADKIEVEYNFAIVEGCGCYTIYSGFKGRGKSGRVCSGQKKYSNDLDIKKARSFKKLRPRLRTKSLSFATNVKSGHKFIMPIVLFMFQYFQFL